MDWLLSQCSFAGLSGSLLIVGTSGGKGGSTKRDQEDRDDDLDANLGFHIVRLGSMREAEASDWPAATGRRASRT